jgi:hypothetical protein
MISSKDLNDEEIAEALGNIEYCTSQKKTKADIMSEFGYSEPFITT